MNILFSVCKEPKRISNEPWDKLKLEDFACPPIILSAATDYRPPAKKSESDENVGNSNPENHATSTPRNVTLTCLVEASPAPKVEWLWQGHPIKNNSQSSIGSAVFIITESGEFNFYLHFRIKNGNALFLFTKVPHPFLLRIPDAEKATFVVVYALTVFISILLTINSLNHSF